MGGWLQTPWKCFISPSLFLPLIFILSSLHPTVAILGGLFFFFFVFNLFLWGSVAKSKAAPLQSVRGYDKNPCNKGLLCNLMGPETGRSVHFNELRSPFLITVVEEMTHWIILPGKTHTHTLRMCELYGGLHAGYSNSSVDKICCDVRARILGTWVSGNKALNNMYIDNIRWVWSIYRT